MSAVRILLDENVDTRLLAAVRRRSSSVEISQIGEPERPALGTKDPELLEWCEVNQYSLVTNNRRSMPGHLTDHLAAGRHVPGIFILSEDMSFGEIVDELLLIEGASEAEEYRDQLVYLPLFR